MGHLVSDGESAAVEVVDGSSTTARSRLVGREFRSLSNFDADNTELVADCRVSGADDVVNSASAGSGGLEQVKEFSVVFVGGLAVLEFKVDGYVECVVGWGTAENESLDVVQGGIWVERGLRGVCAEVVGVVEDSLGVFGQADGYWGACDSVVSVDDGDVLDVVVGED